MTSKSFLKKFGYKIVLALTIISVLCFSLFFVTACGKDTTEVSDPNYSYTDSNDGLISNGTFAYGTVETALTSYPKTSVTGWSRSSSGSANSLVNSGVVDVTENGWNALQTKLLGDSDYRKYVYNKYDFTEDDVKSAIRDDKDNPDYSPTDSEINEYILENYIKKTDGEFVIQNPAVREGAADNKIYMLNNINVDYIGNGMSQKITSSSSITLNKGEYGKISVWIKTQNVASKAPEAGVCITVTNTFNSSSQADYQITNITADEWTEYVIYVKADRVYSCGITVVLGLGNGTANPTEGTAYFDDVTFTHLTKEEYDGEVASKTLSENTFVYSGEDAIKVKSDNGFDAYLYNMSFDDYIAANVIGYLTEVGTDKFAGDYTKSNISADGGVISGDRYGGTASLATENDAQLSCPTADYAHVTLEKASYTLSLGKDDPFTVNPESYRYVEFFIRNQLNKFFGTNITVDVWDINGTAKEKRAAVATFSEVSEEWVKCGIMVKNNFTEGDREFYIDIIIGPADVAATVDNTLYATGDVYISSPVCAEGLSYQYDKTDKTQETENYDLFSLFQSGATGSTALYAGEQNDYSEDNDNVSYSLGYASSDIGTITSRPANPTDYTGVVSDHIYIKEETEDNNLSTEVNTRVNGDAAGNYAGLVNSRYVKDYSDLPDLAEKLGASEEKEDSIQPLMIYNKVAGNYGFIGSAATIGASAYAKISVKVRVTDAAVAYIYLVDVSEKTKNVMKFNTFTVNTDGEEDIKDGKEYSDLQLMFKVTADMMKSDGWLTVEFYVATGASSKDFRVEMWNGGRDGSAENASTGYVFFDEISVNTSGAFSEPSKWTDAFTVSGNPLYDAGIGAFDGVELLMHKRVLTEAEEKFNKEQTDSANIITYYPKYVWIKTDSMIYAVMNTVDPVEVDPFDTDTETEEGSGCVAQTDPSTFWMSFSTILLAVALVLAIVMLIVKNVRRRRKANESDAKSHFTVTSRTSKAKKPSSPKAEEKEEPEEVEPEPENDEEEKQVPAEEQKLDDYVYGDVQDFGTEENRDDENK